MPIPYGSQRILDQFGPETSQGWKENFYIRNIQPLVGLNITQDYEGSSDIEKAKALQTFVNNWPQSGHDTMLAATMNNFDAVARQSLPGIVTRQFSDNAEKNRVKSAYQQLVLLEVVYQVQGMAKQQQQESLNKDWQGIQKWAQTKEKSLTPSALKAMLKTIKLKVFGTFFEDSYPLITDTIPYFIKTAFMHFMNGARRFFNGSSSREKYKNLFLGTAQAALIPATLSFRLFFHIFKFIGNLTSLPFNLFAAVLNKFQRPRKLVEGLKSGVAFLRNIKNSLLLAVGLYYTLPMIFLLATCSTGAYIISSVGLGGVLGILDKILALSGVERRLTQKGSPLLSYQQLFVLTLSIFAVSTPTHIHNGLTEFSALYARGTQVFNRMRRFFQGQNRGDDTLVERGRVLEAIIEAFNDSERFAGVYLGVDLSGLRDIVIQEGRNSLGLPAQAAPEQASSPLVDYDRNRLIGQIMRLKANLEKTQKEEGVDVVNALNEMRNPHTDLPKRKSDLPKALQKLAQPLGTHEGAANSSQSSSSSTAPVTPLRELQRSRSGRQNEQERRVYEDPETEAAVNSLQTGLNSLQAGIEATANSLQAGLNSNQANLNRIEADLNSIRRRVQR